VPPALSVLPRLPAVPENVLTAICAHTLLAPSIIKKPPTMARHACRSQERGSEFFLVSAGWIFMTDDV
jgi:hypothetical protein